MDERTSRGRSARISSFSPTSEDLREVAAPAAHRAAKEAPAQAGFHAASPGPTHVAELVNLLDTALLGQRCAERDQR